MKSQEMRSTKLLIALVILLIMSFALRVAQLNTPIWGDEVATWAIARRTPIDKMLHFSLHDPSPPLYYALVNLALPLFGASFVGLRWLSVLFGILILPTAYWLMRQAHFPAKDSLYVVLLTAVSSMLVFYSQEARAYALLAFLSLLSIGFLWRCVREPNRTNTIILTILIILLAFTHRSAFFLIVAEIAFLLLHRRWQPFILTLTVFSLILLSIFIQIARGTFSFGPSGDPANSEALISLITTFTTGTIGMQYISKMPGRLGLAFPTPVLNQLLPVAGIVVLIVVLVIGVSKFIRQKKFSAHHQYIIMLWFCILVPVGLGLLAGTPLSPRPQWLLRGLIYVWPLYFIAVVATTSQSKIRPYLILTLVILNIMSLYAYYSHYTRFDDDIVFDQLNALADGDDLIIADPWYMFEVVNYYYHGQAARAGFNQEEDWIDVTEMSTTYEPGLLVLNRPPTAGQKIFVYYRATNLAWADLFPDNEIFVYQRDAAGWQKYEP